MQTLLEIIGSLELRKTETEQRFEALDFEDSRLDFEIYDTSRQIDKAREAKTESMEADIEKLNAKLLVFREKLDRVRSEASEAENAMAFIDDKLQHMRAELCSILRRSFIEHGLMQTTTEIAKSSQGDVSSSISSLLADSAATGEDASADETPKEVLSPEQIRKNEEKEQQRQIRSVYQSARQETRELDAQFEYRFDKFDKEIAQHEQERAAGKTVQDIQVLYTRHFHETRQLTQELAKAEEAYNQAKEAALAAGVDVFDSQLSSCFVDKPDDGYRMSGEDDVSDPIDDARIETWLQEVPADELANEVLMLSELHSSCFEGSEVFYSAATSIVDEWEAESVDMCDSRSMVAEGADKRRIRKWETLRSSQLAVARDLGTA
jgi:hypothetical protein